MKNQTIESLPPDERQAIESHLEWMENQLGSREAAEELATRILIKIGPQQRRTKHCCMFPDECLMTSDHSSSECHTVEMFQDAECDFYGQLVSRGPQQ